MSGANLLIIPSVPLWKEDGYLIFDRKFYDGILLYINQWPGSLSCCMYASDSALPAFGVVRKKQTDLPFNCIVMNNGEKVVSETLKGFSLVLVSGDSYKYFHLSSLCKKLHIKCVYIIEYTPETRYQIADLSTKNFFLKLRRKFFIFNGERKRLSAFSHADGLQANGAAAYNEYRKFKNAILYFDTRVNKHLIINEIDLMHRLEHLSCKQALRLAFSGRLLQMKGADHLIEVARLLHKRNVDFKLSIYGAGDLGQKMRDDISRFQLEHQVLMKGSVDFYEELLPAIKQTVDLFICLHRQSDPSCTYLETLSCGVPIVGYLNKAFAGLLELADIGWGAELNDIGGIVDLIKRLDNNRELLAQKSINSMQFAIHNSFEETFAKRVKHLAMLEEGIG